MERNINWEAIGAIGELLGAAAVIATLGYLAFQIRQNNKLLAAQARYNLTVQRSGAIDSILAPNVLEATQKYSAGEGVTPAERGAALVIALKIVEMWEWQYGEYREGMLKREELPVKAWRIWYRGEGEVPAPIREVWEARKKVVSPDFAQFFEENVVNGR